MPAQRDRGPHINKALSVAHIHMRRGRYTDARQIYSNIIDGAPDIPEAHYGLANAMMLQGNPEYTEAVKVIMELDQAIVLNPEYQLAHFKKAVELSVTWQQYEMALPIVEKSITLKPGDPLGHLLKARILFNMGQETEGKDSIKNFKLTARLSMQWLIERLRDEGDVLSLSRQPLPHLFGLMRQADYL
jgi:predicted Zn-dependent protease